ncbi:hypothetical protein LUZ60_006442 [Juncus effusus]|nr:hypothetical protein LUZ60_006442 [Juncus effusus]
MVAGSSSDGGMSHGVRSTIRSIKEIVGDHSESDIYAVLKETNMDPNETTQRLLDQDPFHEVRRRRDRKKENVNVTTTNGIKIQNESRIDRRIPNERRSEWKSNENRTESRQNESRITNNSESRNEWKYNHSESRNELKINSESRNEWKINGERSTEYNKQNEYRAEFVKTERVWNSNGYHNNNYYYNNTRSVRGGYARTSRGGHTRNPVPVPGPVKEYRIVRDNRNKPKSDEEKSEPISSPNPDSQILNSDQTKNTPKQESTVSIEPIKSNSNQPKKESAAEICSSSDPVHHSDGLIRREVGVVGLRKPNPNPNPNPNSESRNSASVHFQSNRGFAPENQRQYLRPNSRGNNRLNSQPVMNLNQYSGKSQQVNMEWRPKSSQSPRNGPALTLTGQSQQKQEDSNISSENLAKLKVSEDQHVIIPEHLRVPESEQTRLVFGSFDSPKKSTEGNENNNHTLLSIVSVPPNENLPSVTEQNNTEINETHLRENANMQQGPSDEAGPQDDITENISNYESTLPHDLQDNSTDLQNFKKFDPSSRYDMQFLSSSAGQETTVLSTEAMSVGPSMIPTTQTIPILQTPPQALQNYQNTPQQIPQMYPPPQLQQLQLPQFAHPTNYLPYRHVFSPVYMPHQPLQNYQNAPAGPAYPPQIPSPVPNYLVANAGTVPGTGGVKYGTSQYKAAVFSANGYGGYSNNPNGYPGLIEDANRMKYKENNVNTLYAPNLQVEASDIWVQTPRELPPNIQSTQFYQAQPATPSYLNGPASYSATQQPPQLQYPPPPLHQTGQPGSMALLPPVGHNLAGLGAPGVGAPFQGSHPLGHLGWTGVNF